MLAQDSPQHNHQTISRIFIRHMMNLRPFGADTDVVRYAMKYALDELAIIMFHDDEALDTLLARIERVLESHDSALYADVASGATDLATAIDAALTTERAAIAALTNDLRQAQTVAASQRQEIAAMTTERSDLLSQLAQPDADNARLTQELRTVRSWVTTPSNGNGKSAPAALTDATEPAPELLRQVVLSPAANDYWIGLDANRWSWRGVPRTIRLELVRHVISTTPNHSQSEFDAARPSWMATASSHVQTFGVPWSQLSDLTREIEVAA